MKKIKLLIALTCVVITFTGCKKIGNFQQWKEGKQEVGWNKDEHECISSAGYCWSDVRQECVRPFEVGVKLTNSLDTHATLSAFVVFDTDSLNAELFLPGNEGTIILMQDKSIWGNGTYSLYRRNGKLIIEKLEEQLFSE